MRVINEHWTDEVMPTVHHKRLYDMIRDTSSWPDDERPVPADPAVKRVYEVVDDLTAGRIRNPVDRSNLRRALDKADAPLAGRALGDSAIGNLSGNKAKPNGG